MMNGYWKTGLAFLAAAVTLVGWGMTWANQSARICANQSEIGTLKEKMESVADQTTESEKAIVRMETKIEYIIKGVDEIKSEVKGRAFE
jgi:hypothetical protein